jgi:deoxyribose-phosphate aldolase
LILKTSTGKIQLSATLEAAEIILNVIRNCGKQIGFKVSGSIRSYKVEYIQLADSILHSDYIDSKTFRFGVSRLLENLLNITKEHTYGY